MELCRRIPPAGDGAVESDGSGVGGTDSKSGRKGNLAGEDDGGTGELLDERGCAGELEGRGGIDCELVGSG